MFSAKMAASFKVPSLVKRSKLGTSFPKFDWRDIEINEELRSGTFGHVFRATFVKESGNVVIKKLKGESAESRHQFKREAEPKQSKRDTYRNVAEFLRVCEYPYAIMMVYACFLL